MSTTSKLDLHVEMLMYNDGKAVLSDGTCLPILSYIDIDGDDCGPEDAVAAVAGIEGVGYWSIDLSEFVEISRDQFH